MIDEDRLNDAIKTINNKAKKLFSSLFQLLQKADDFYLPKIRMLLMNL